MLSELKPGDVGVSWQSWLDARNTTSQLWQKTQDYLPFWTTDDLEADAGSGSSSRLPGRALIVFAASPNSGFTQAPTSAELERASAACDVALAWSSEDTGRADAVLVNLSAVSMTQRVASQHQAVVGVLPRVDTADKAATARMWNMRMHGLHLGHVDVLASYAYDGDVWLAADPGMAAPPYRGLHHYELPALNAGVARNASTVLAVLSSCAQAVLQLGQQLADKVSPLITVATCNAAAPAQPATCADVASAGISEAWLACAAQVVGTVIVVDDPEHAFHVSPWAAIALAAGAHVLYSGPSESAWMLPSASLISIVQPGDLAASAKAAQAKPAGEPGAWREALNASAIYQARVAKHANPWCKMAQWVVRLRDEGGLPVMPTPDRRMRGTAARARARRATRMDLAVATAEQARRAADSCSSKFSFVTAANTRYYRELRNFIGSVQVFAPGTPIHVYDLGLAEGEVAQLRTICQVASISKVEFGAYPPIVAKMGEFGWKTVIENDAADRLACFSLQDSGQELHNTVAPLLNELGNVSIGVWMVIQGSFPDSYTHPAVLAYFNMTRGQFEMNPKLGAPAGGINGLRPSASRWRLDVWRQWQHCGMQQACIAPPGATRQNSRQDQLALALLTHRHGGWRGIHWETKYFAWHNKFVSKLPADPTEPSDVITLLSRRTNNPKPFDKLLKFCPNSTAPVMRTVVM